jgi:hypothetical protein
MGFFIDQAPYEREIEAPSGEKGTVKLRRLNAGDQAAIQDTLRMSINEDADASMAIGTMRMLTVRRALVGWSWMPSPTPETISQLEPEVFEQIYSYCEMGTPPTLPTTDEAGDGTQPQDGTESEAAEPAEPTEESEAETVIVPPKARPKAAAAS